ncbi:hypothetical protein WG66_015397 [Moniliophthora roreri]|uniref:MSP domain-containing protein n=1 Tax=Moniliophthora roreri TaxID=221103 RepID=A0A0W0G2H1_MONRR|nr:hypothetical protein WG66_015397 [Moniliophthora roreri]
MPIDTTASEVIFEIVNDTDEPVRLFKGSVTTTLDKDDCLAIVLMAGTTYHYTIAQRTRTTQIMVKSWQDIRCKVSIFTELMEVPLACRPPEG